MENKHYKDNTGFECDAIIVLEDGRWASIEIELGDIDLIEEGTHNLNRLKNKIEEKSKEKKPVFYDDCYGIWVSL